MDGEVLQPAVQGEYELAYVRDLAQGKPVGHDCGLVFRAEVVVER